MRTTIGALALLTVLAAGAPAASQDFTLEVGPAIAGNSTLVKKAAVVVRPVACDPASVTITGTAEGIANGRRVSVPLRLVALETPGVYAVPRVWEQGRWVLSLSGQCAGRRTVASAIVPLGPQGFDRNATTYLTRAATVAEIEAAIRDTRTVTE